MNIVRIVTMWQALFVALLLVVGCAATPGKISQVKSVPEIDATHGVGLEGYDAVAYFTDDKPVPGSSSFFSVRLQGDRVMSNSTRAVMGKP